jgi:GDPmannose 4,6-dehydratase
MKRCTRSTIIFGLCLCTNFLVFADGGTVSKKRALIFGVTGQDGSFLAEFLLEKGYEVHGVKRRSASFNTGRIDHIYVDQHADQRPDFVLHYGDLTDSLNVVKLIGDVKPDEIYNLGAQSHVQVSFELPEYTADCDGIGALRILDAIRSSGLAQTTRYYQASTSELFGKVSDPIQNEQSAFYPRSPYGVAKLYAFWITKNYREAYGIFACNGILFNHESERRAGNFVTRKITRAVAHITQGGSDILYLGNLDAQRDWGYARDYVEAMWLMLQQPQPDDFVIATGEAHTVREFVEKSFACVGTSIVWAGSGVNEVGKDKQTSKVLVKIDPRYFRLAEVDFLCGDASKAHKMLGWQPKTSFDSLVQLMVKHDLQAPDEYV